MTGRRLLALDGGGFRGLSSLLILKELMRKLEPDANLPPKPCDYFDIIGGTSTGGLIAIMLGRLEMDVDACIDAYKSLSETVFQKKTSSLSLKLKVQGKFDSSRLEDAIKIILAQQRLGPDELLRSPPDAKCKVFVCATSREVGAVVRLRSYDTKREAGTDLKIWQAGRATSAAPSFFDHITIDDTGETFVDGALGANNPINHVWAEAQDLWDLTDNDVQCILSVGTGTTLLRPMGNGAVDMAASLVRMVTDCDHTAELFVQDKHNLDKNGCYYRFSVPNGLGSLKMDDCSQKGMIQAATSNYMRSQDIARSLQACASKLKAANSCNNDSSYIEKCAKILIDKRAVNQFNQTEIFDESPWLLQHHLYKLWNDPPELHKNAEAAFLTLRGKPGAGKSVLMKQVIAAHIPDPTGAQITLHHFFHPFSSTEKAEVPRKSCIAMLQSLLGQLVAQVHYKPWYNDERWLTELQKLADSGSILWLQQQIEQTMIRNKTQSDHKTTRFRIFIDAIEECADYPPGDVSHARSTRNNILQVLKFVSELLSKLLDAGVEVAICVSRQSLSDYGKLEECGGPSIGVDQDQYAEEAVRAYVVKTLKELGKPALEWVLLQKLKPHLSYGFLWAKLVINEILRQADSTQDAKLVELLNIVPSELDVIYRRQLKPAATFDKSGQLRVFKLALGVLQQLSAVQFREALAFTEPFKHESIGEWETSANGFHPDKFKNRLRQDSCGLLEVSKVKKSKLPGTEFVVTEDDQVRFIHPSVIHFLRRDEGLKLLYPELSTSLDSQCHAYLFSCCMRALDFYSLDGHDDSQFLDYAHEFWPEHARASGDLVETVETLPDFILRCSDGTDDKVSRVIRSHVSRLRESQKKQWILLDKSQNNMMVLLATMGCTKLLERHLQSCFACKLSIKSYNNQSAPFGIALRNAILGRWEETALFLLNRHSQGDINSLVQGRTIMYRACYSGDTEVLKFLIEKKVSAAVSSPGGYVYPLHAAVALGNQQVIAMLLDAGEEMARKLLCLRFQQNGWTVLHFAVKIDEAAVKLDTLKALLKLAPKGVNLLGEKDKSGKTPVDLAEEIAQGGGSGGIEGKKLLDALKCFQNDERVHLEIDMLRKKELRKRDLTWRLFWFLISILTLVSSYFLVY